ncbi:hypothetical protein N7535_001573 [Penicillium sp. DV-2018c]|nr:hypothetical protein N7461_005183 [Penicillium sp. DV-2018c]KAJ5582953.1 hypothetical protein N7535_001573 [Penicillium sp. DV-2018c]
MAATHGTATHLPAKPMAISTPTVDDEVLEYEKILTISDQIFSGNHPRLSVPQHLVRKSGQLAHNVPVRSHLPKKPISNEAVDSAPVVSNTGKPYLSPQSASARTAVSAAPQPARVSKPTSEIDPIFLTKSDDLIRAELQLQRQRLERALRDQGDLRKQEAKQRPAVQDTKPEFDVSEVFKQALEMVKPVSMSDASEASVPDAAASELFDENSVYSSRAPDSPPQAAQRSSPAATLAQTASAAHVPVTHYSDELQRLEALNQPGSDREMQDAYIVADQRHSYSQKQTGYHKPEAPVSQSRDPLLVEMEEPEYSPPAPAAPPADHRGYPSGVESGTGRQSRPDARYADRTRDIRRTPSPEIVNVVRNHITSPVAPQPSHMSPLAITKGLSAVQIRDGRYGHGSDPVNLEPHSALGSPNAPAPKVVSRKRRRLREGDEGSRQSLYKRQHAEPTEVFIKEEPVSPPPFADDPIVVRDRHPQERRPVRVDIASPRYTPVYESRGPSMREPVYEIDPYHESTPDVGRQPTISRLSTRRPVRDEADLRRVASVQYARQSDYPREYIEAPPRPIRAASYVVERPGQERPRYYEEAPYPRHRYIAVDDLPPPLYREPYYEDALPARVMAPPQRRIVVDEHGNQYYEIPQAPKLQPIPPTQHRSVSQMPRGVYDERPPHHAGSVRAASIVQDPYVEPRYVQEMPPPQPVYRRVASDYARPPTAHERPSYVAPSEGHEAYTRSGSVQVAEYLPPRHPVYIDDRGAPQERLIRTASVRPPNSRYDNPHEVVRRVGSVRPTGPVREHSVFMDDRPVVDYVERPYFIREQRYYEDEGEEGGRLGLDGTNDTIQRVPQGYQ